MHKHILQELDGGAAFAVIQEHLAVLYLLHHWVFQTLLSVVEVLHQLYLYSIPRKVVVADIYLEVWHKIFDLVFMIVQKDLIESSKLVCAKLTLFRVEHWLRQDLVLSEENVSRLVDCPILLQGFCGGLRDIGVILFYKGILEVRFGVSFVIVGAHRAAHHLTLVAGKHDLLVMVKLAVRLLNFWMVVSSLLGVASVRRMTMLVFGRFQNFLDGLFWYISQQTRSAKIFQIIRLDRFFFSVFNLLDERDLSRHSCAGGAGLADSFIEAFNLCSFLERVHDWVFLIFTNLLVIADNCLFFLDWLQISF
jgi:hypothetical protein